MPLEVADTARLSLGEGSLWDPEAQRLYWIGIEDRQLRWLDHATGGSHLVQLDTRPGTVALHRGERVVLSVAEGFAELDTATGALTRVADVEADRPDRRMNDGKPDPYGRLVAGTMTVDEPRRPGPLYRLEAGPDGAPQAVVLRGGMLIPNGLDWPEPDLLWHIDTPTHRVDLYAYPERGPLADPIRSLDLSEHSGCPDGMTLDAEGNLWIAFWDGGAVRCFSPEGRLLETVEVPTAQPSSCAFGGPDLDTLYITSAGGGPGAADPEAGALFRYPGLTLGRPARRWSGAA